MRRLPEVRLERLPRMAEFAEWATAAEEGLGLKKGAFMDAYAEARSDAVGQALEGDAVAEAVLAFMADKREWAGTSSELHRWLAFKVDANTQRTRGWPKTSSYLSAKIKRLAPALRAVGLEWEEWQEGDKNKTRRKRLRWREGEGPSKEEIEERKRQRSGGGLFGPPTLVEEQEGDG